MTTDNVRCSGWTICLCIALALGCVAGAYASVCPLTIVSGTGEKDGIVLTVRDYGKLPIRRLEFRCIGPTGKAGACREENALFYPGMEYTLRYPYPAGKPGIVTVAVEDATMSDGFVWKPSKKQPCRQLHISPPKARR
jgi:hypothetical protein